MVGGSESGVCYIGVRSERLVELEVPERDGLVVVQLLDDWLDEGIDGDVGEALQQLLELLQHELPEGVLVVLDEDGDELAVHGLRGEDLLGCECLQQHEPVHYGEDAEDVRGVACGLLEQAEHRVLGEHVLVHLLRVVHPGSDQEREAGHPVVPRVVCPHVGDRDGLLDPPLDHAELDELFGYLGVHYSWYRLLELRGERQVGQKRADELQEGLDLVEALGEVLGEELAGVVAGHLQEHLGDGLSQVLLPLVANG